MTRLPALALAVAAAYVPTTYAAQYMGHEVHDSRLIVVWDTEADKSKASTGRYSAYNQMTQLKQGRHLNNIETLQKPSGQSLKQSITALESIPGVKAVYPDYFVEAFTTPNDPAYDRLWGMHSDTDFDINAPESWDYTTGSQDVVIGVLDTGIDYNHEDLAANIWTNPDEIAGNGIDDDNNGYIDDVHGIDTRDSDSDPMDDVGHGSHVAGTIAGVGNNAIGVAGVAWQATLIPCRFLDYYGGYASGAIECLDYLASLKSDKGINLVATNNSWGGGAFNQVLIDAIEAHNELGILFVAAAGNAANNNDLSPTYPASYDVENIISVAAIDEDGALADFSNYGAASVDIAAPGVEIYSSVPGDAYDSYSGTSMAAPHVTGALALMAAQYPNAQAQGLKTLLLNSAADQELYSNATRQGRLQLVNPVGEGAINCADSTSVSRVSPASDAVTALYGDTVDVSYASFQCAEPGDAISINYRGNDITLVDDGTGSDSIAGDGLYSGTITIDWLGEASVSVNGYNEEHFTLTGIDMPSIREVEYQWEDVEGTVVLASSDDSVANIDLDFALTTPFGNTSRVRMSSNGLVFTGDDYTSRYSNQALPSLEMDQVLAPYWDDLIDAGSGSYSYAITGTAPDRKLVINYNNINYFGSSSSTVTFQVVLNESLPVVMFNYQSVTSSDSSVSNGAAATVGFEFDGYGETYSYNNPLLQDEMSLMVAGADIEYPQISRFEYSGLPRVGYPMTFVAELGSDSPEGSYMLLDLNDGNGPQAYESGTEVTVSYDAEAIYTPSVQALTDNASTSASLTISVLNLSDVEQALIDQAAAERESAIINNPDEFGLVTTDELDEQISAAVQAVLDNPAAYGLAVVMNTSEDIAALEAGTHLLGASTDITDLDSFFTDVRFVWVYEDAAFKGWSPDANLLIQLQNSGYSVLDSIESGQGFWVTKQ